MKYFIDDKKCRFNILTWCKTNPTPATDGTYLPDIEYCLVFKEKGSSKYNDGYELKSKWYVSPINKRDKDKFEHPTIKPLEFDAKELKILLDYITNLQEENKRLKQTQYVWSYDLDMQLEDYKSRNKKAIKYIQDSNILAIYKLDYFIKDLLNILQGEDKDE